MDQHPSNSSRLYITFDGDDIGRKISSKYIKNDEVGLRSLCTTVEYCTQNIARYLESVGFRIVFRAADGVTGATDEPETDIYSLFQTINTSLKNTGLTFSAGAGPSLKSAYLAMIHAKSSGRNTIKYLEVGE